MIKQPSSAKMSLANFEKENKITILIKSDTEFLFSFLKEYKFFMPFKY